MASEAQPLDDLADAVLEGTSIDWASAESSAGAPDREAVKQLKVLAGIAELHRNLTYVIPESARPDVPGERLERWGRLELRELIGRGSFGEVYRAWDSKLDREVAVKLLHAGPSHPEDTTVLREARLLARVRHPNVVTVYDADEIEGRVGLWMEFIRGRNLEQILGEREKLDDREVTRIGIDLCRALSAVHEAGLIHRDIKTQNLMQAGDGRLVLMDFGTGRELEKAPTAAVDAAGTPLYLAPEIFNGAQATVRSDIYSVGVLLFHLLTGAYPVRGATVKEVREAHARDVPLDMEARAPRVARTLAAVIRRAIHPDPAGRFESSRDMLAALESEQRRKEALKRKRYAMLLGAVSVIAIAVAVVPPLIRRNPGTLQALPFQARDWVLVASFENRTDEKLFDGTLDYALGRELSNSRHVSVASRDRVNDALQLMRKPPNSLIDAELAREVCLRDDGIRALLTGRVERLGSRYLLSVELVDPRRGATLAGFSEESSGMDGSLDAIRRIADRVRAALGEAPAAGDPERARAPRVTTSNLKALWLYSRADLLVGQGGSPGAAEELLRQAVAEDPRFASAWIHLAWALHNQKKPLAEVEPCAQTALRLADTTTERERYFIRGSYYHLLGQREKAIAAYEALLALYPDHHWAVQNLSNGLYDWKHDPRDLEKAVEVEARWADARPKDFYANQNVAFDFTVMRPDPARARPYLRRATELITPRITEDFAELVAWVRLLPSTESWLKGEPGTAAAVIDRVASTIDSFGGRSRDSFASATALGYLTLGWLETARQMSGKINDAVVRNDLLARIAFLGGDARTLRNRLRLPRDRPPEEETIAILQARAGLVSEARRFVRDAERRHLNAVAKPQDDPGFHRTPDPELHSVSGEIALAQGDAATAIAELEKAMKLESRWFRMQPGFYLVSESLSAALRRTGNLKRAIEVLEEASEQKVQGVVNFESGPFWLRTRLELARIYRTVGRLGDARAIESDLRKLLVLADANHPLLLGLERLQ